jgi:predicted nucleotide-binding protein
MNLAQELKSRAALLDDVGWQEATRRVVGMLNWMNEQSEIKHILDDLKAKGRVYKQLNIGTDRRRVAEVATDPSDVAAIGLAMAEACFAHNGIDQFHQIAHSFGVQPLPSMVYPADFLANQAIKLYIKPLLNFVAEQLPQARAAEILTQPSREQLTFEFLKALYDEHKRNPQSQHWINLEVIWSELRAKHGENFDLDFAADTFRHLCDRMLVNEVSRSDGGVNIQINERGIASYELMKASQPAIPKPETSDPRKVFVVYGRNDAANRAMFEFLRAIGLAPLEWSQIVAETGKASPYTGEILARGFAIARAVVVLLTPDDEARLKGALRKPDDPPYETQLTGQARPNVLFEAGMAIGLHPDRTVLVELGRLRPFTDVLGRHVVRLDNSVARRQDLANRLKSAGCAVNLDGSDWHSAGTFVVRSAKGVLLMKAPGKPNRGRGLRGKKGVTLKFTLNPGEALRRGIDCPDLSGTIEIVPASLTGRQRDLIANRMQPGSADVHSLVVSQYGQVAIGDRIAAVKPDFSSLMEAIEENERTVEAELKRHQEEESDVPF